MGVTGDCSGSETLSREGFFDKAATAGSKSLAFLLCEGGAADDLVTRDWPPKESVDCWERAAVLPPRRRAGGMLEER